MINYIKNILNRQWSRTIFRYLLYQIFFRPEAIPSIITVVDYMTSLNLVPSGNFPRVFFPSGNFPNVLFFQTATSQVCPSRSAQSTACSTPDPSQPQRSAPIAACGTSEGLTFGKLPLGKLHIWEVATWENAFGKVPNTNIYASFSSNVSQPRSRLMPQTKLRQPSSLFNGLDTNAYGAPVTRQS